MLLQFSARGLAGLDAANQQPWTMKFGPGVTTLSLQKSSEVQAFFAAFFHILYPDPDRLSDFLELYDRRAQKAAVLIAFEGKGQKRVRLQRDLSRGRIEAFEKTGTSEEKLISSDAREVMQFLRSALALPDDRAFAHLCVFDRRFIAAPQESTRLAWLNARAPHKPGGASTHLSSPSLRAPTAIAPNPFLERKVVSALDGHKGQTLAMSESREEQISRLQDELLRLKAAREAKETQTKVLVERETLAQKVTVADQSLTEMKAIEARFDSNPLPKIPDAIVEKLKSYANIKNERDVVRSRTDSEISLLRKQITAAKNVAPFWSDKRVWVLIVCAVVCFALGPLLGVPWIAYGNIWFVFAIAYFSFSSLRNDKALVEAEAHLKKVDEEKTKSTRSFELETGVVERFAKESGFLGPDALIRRMNEMEEWTAQLEDVKTRVSSVQDLEAMRERLGHLEVLLNDLNKQIRSADNIYSTEEQIKTELKHLENKVSSSDATDEAAPESPATLWDMGDEETHQSSALGVQEGMQESGSDFARELICAGLDVLDRPTDAAESVLGSPLRSYLEQFKVSDAKLRGFTVDATPIFESVKGEKLNYSELSESMRLRVEWAIRFALLPQLAARILPMIWIPKISVLPKELVEPAVETLLPHFQVIVGSK